MQQQSTTLEGAHRASVLATVPLAGTLRPALQACEAIAFTRVSTTVQESRPDQLAAIERDAARHDVPVTLHLGGEHSRWDADAEDYRKLEEAVTTGRYSHLWLFKADRLGGEDVDFIRMVRRALRAGMEVRDTIIGPITDENVAFLGMISHMEIKACSERTIMRLEALAEQGHKLGSVPIGYRPGCREHPCKCNKHGKPEKDPVAGPVVKKLFERYANGESLAVLWRWFNAELGMRKDRLAIERILKNPYYWGLNVNCRMRHSMVLKHYARPKEEWKVTMHDQPLVDRETFERVQARLDQPHGKRGHWGQRTRHSLSGLLRCGQCQRRLSAHRTGGESWVWRCPLCYKTRGTQRVERAIRECLDTMPLPAEGAGERYAARVGDERMEIEAAMGAIDAQLAKIGRRRATLRCREADGDMSWQDLQDALAETADEQRTLNEQREVLIQRLAVLPAHANLQRTIVERLRGLERWTDGLDKQAVEEQQQMYRECISRAVVDFGAGTMTVEYRPALAAWCGRSSDTVPLPSQKAR